MSIDFLFQKEKRVDGNKLASCMFRVVHNSNITFLIEPQKANGDTVILLHKQYCKATRVSHKKYASLQLPSVGWQQG